MSLNRTKLAFPSLTCGGAVKVDFDGLPANPREVLQEANELQFIVRVFEVQSKFGDQIMTVDQVRHSAIVLKSDCHL